MAAQNYGEQARNAVPAAMQLLAELVDAELGRLAVQRMGGNYTGTWNPTDKLGIRTGATAASLLPGGPGHVATVTVSAEGGRIQIGSNSTALAINEGDGTPGQRIEIHSKGRMQAFFWAMFASTQQLFYKVMALSVMKKGFVTITTRPVLAPAAQELEATTLSALAERVAQQIADAAFV